MRPSQQERSTETLPLRNARLGSLDVAVDRQAGGVIYLRNKHPLGAYAYRLTDRLHHWAEHAPDRTFMAERGPDGGWRRISYRDALDQVRTLGAALLSRGLSGQTSAQAPHRTQRNGSNQMLKLHMRQRVDSATAWLAV